MIEGAEVSERSDGVLRLASLPNGNIQAVLLARGVDPLSLNEAIEAVAAVGIPVNAAEAIDFMFRPRPEPPPFPTGRFGDGTYAVLYTALEIETCLEEVRHHQQQAVLAGPPFPRYFTAMRVQFKGGSMMLLGHEARYPDLVSPTEAGYPFCQAVARWAKGARAHALHTASARKADGTCVPVFVREQLDSPATAERYRFVRRGDIVEYEKLTAE